MDHLPVDRFLVDGFLRNQIVKYDTFFNHCAWNFTFNISFTWKMVDTEIRYSLAKVVSALEPFNSNGKISATSFRANSGGETISQVRPVYSTPFITVQCMLRYFSVHVGFFGTFFTIRFPIRHAKTSNWTHQVVMADIRKEFEKYFWSISPIDVRSFEWRRVIFWCANAKRAMALPCFPWTNKTSLT